MSQVLDQLRWPPDPWVVGEYPTRRSGISMGSAAVGHVQAGTLAAHPTRPLYVSGSSTGRICLWQFGDANCKAAYVPLASTAQVGWGALQYGMMQARVTGSAIRQHRQAHKYAFCCACDTPPLTVSVAQQLLSLLPPKKTLHPSPCRPLPRSSACRATRPCPAPTGATPPPHSPPLPDTFTAPVTDQSPTPLLLPPPPPPAPNYRPHPHRSAC
jgi:hypothetical protein